MRFAELATAATTWLLSTSPPRVVVSVERDGSLVLTSDGPAPADDPPAGLRASCGAWELGADAAGRVRLRIVADPARVAGSVDEPDTLFALHSLASRRPASRLVLKLPPEHVGRRW